MTYKKILINILLVVSIACFAFSAFKLGKYGYETWRTKKNLQELSSLVEDESQAAQSDYVSEEDKAAADRAAMQKKYGKLYAQNPDFIGWLTVDGTAIDYPVMYTPKDPQHYLRRNFNGDYDIAGMIFVDGRCSLTPGKVSTNTIIYGHRMKNDTMFGPLRYYKDPQFCKEHSTVRFDTLYRPGTYQIFASFLAQATSDTSKFVYYDFVQAEDEKDLTDYLANIKKSAIYYDDANAPQYGDEFITLSTCDYYAQDGRLAVMAKRVGD